jgi:hypothetical protein
MRIHPPLRIVIRLFVRDPTKPSKRGEQVNDGLRRRSAVSDVQMHLDVRDLDPQAKSSLTSILQRDHFYKVERSRVQSNVWVACRGDYQPWSVDANAASL